MTDDPLVVHEAEAVFIADWDRQRLSAFHEVVVSPVNSRASLLD